MGGARGAHPPPLILDQTEARRAEKDFFETAPPPFSKGLGATPLLSLSQGLDAALYYSSSTFCNEMINSLHAR